MKGKYLLWSGDDFSVQSFYHMHHFLNFGMRWHCQDTSGPFFFLRGFVVQRLVDTRAISQLLSPAIHFFQLTSRAPLNLESQPFRRFACLRMPASQTRNGLLHAEFRTSRLTDNWRGLFSTAFSFISRLYVLLVVLALSSGLYAAYAQSTALEFGQTTMDQLDGPSSTVTFTTPALFPGDVIMIRVSTPDFEPEIHLYNPGGTEVGHYIGPYSRVAQGIYTLPQNAVPGIFTIVVSDEGQFYSGEFCISMDRMNHPPMAQFLPCDDQYTHSNACPAEIKSFRFMVQEGSVSQITVSFQLGDQMRPEVWVANEQGVILFHDANNSAQPVVIGGIAADAAQCFSVFVTDTLGYYAGTFNISHNLISGECAAGTLVSNINDDNEICEDMTLNLSIEGALPGAGYAWSGPNGISSSADVFILEHITQSMAGTYSVTVTVPGLCDAVYQQPVVVRPRPQVSVYVDPPSGHVCQGDAFWLQADVISSPSPTVYQWTGPAGLSYSLQNWSVFGQDSTRTGYYELAVTNGYGCVQSDSILVSVHHPPSVSISEPSEQGVCLYDDLTLFTTTDGFEPDFSWTGPNGFVTDVQNPVIENISQVYEGVYYVTVTDAYGCSASDLRYIPVWPLPEAGIDPQAASICVGEMVALTATGGNTYLWSNGANTQTLVITPTLSHTYIVTTTDSNGCSDSESIDVTVHPLPDISLNSIPAQPVICEGDGTILLCAASTSAQNASYSWAGPGFVAAEACIVLDDPSATGLYTATVADGNTGCTQTAAVDIVIHPLPEASILQNPESPVCIGSDFLLCANISGGFNPMFSWTGPGGINLGTSQCIAIENAVVSGSYQIQVIDANGCEANAFHEVSLVPPPVALITGDLVLCQGNTTTLTASGGSGYQWSTGGTGASIAVSPSVNTFYSVTVTNTANCSDITTALVEVMPNTLNLQVEVVENALIAQVSGGNPPYTFSIQPEVQQPNQTGIFAGLPGGTYSITVLDEAGCSMTSSGLLIAVGVADVSESEVFQCRPNPANSRFEVLFLFPPPADAVLVLSDISGKRWGTFPTGRTDHQIIDRGSMPGGIYLLQLINREGMLIGSVRMIFL